MCLCVCVCVCGVCVFVCLHVCVCFRHIAMPSIPSQSRRGVAAFGVVSYALRRELPNGALPPAPYDHASTLLMVLCKAINVQRNATSLAFVRRCAASTAHARTSLGTDREVLCVHLNFSGCKDVPHDKPLSLVHGCPRRTKFQRFAPGKRVGGCHAQQHASEGLPPLRKPPLLPMLQAQLVAHINPRCKFGFQPRGLVRPLHAGGTASPKCYVVGGY